MQMIFASKYHGYGNDFLVVPAEQLQGGDGAAFSRAICEPHFGVGADGCILLSPATAQGFPITIFNQDGSRAGMSGNGTRCAAAYIHHRNISTHDRIAFLTDSGKKIYERTAGDFPVWRYRSQMGEPDFRPAGIPFNGAAGSERVIEEILLIEEDSIPVNALSVGNPQCVVFCECVPHDAVFHRIGRALSTHPAFPEGSNVSFVHVERENEIHIRIWERGVGPTHSSGTGSCGAAVMAIALGKVRSPVEVVSETGRQTVEWEPGREIELTGEAEFVADFQFCWNAGAQVPPLRQEQEA